MNNKQLICITYIFIYYLFIIENRKKAIIVLQYQSTVRQIEFLPLLKKLCCTEYYKYNYNSILKNNNNK